jgi:hypothetical protein
MSRCVIHLRADGRLYDSACCLGKRAIWSRPVSLRADSKLAPCMARPNLFSGD